MENPPSIIKMPKPPPHFPFVFSMTPNCTCWASRATSPKAHRVNTASTLTISKWYYLHVYETQTLWGVCVCVYRGGLQGWGNTGLFLQTLGIFLQFSSWYLSAGFVMHCNVICIHFDTFSWNPHTLNTLTGQIPGDFNSVLLIDLLRPLKPY